MFLLDVAAYNSHVIYKLKNKEKFIRNRFGKRKEFLESLCIELMEPQIEKRAEFLIEENNHVIKNFYREALEKCGYKIIVQNNLNEENIVNKKRLKCKHFECAKNENKQKAVSESCSFNFCVKHSKTTTICINCLVKK